MSKAEAEDAVDSKHDANSDGVSARKYWCKYILILSWVLTIKKIMLMLVILTLIVIVMAIATVINLDCTTKLPQDTNLIALQ